MQSHPKSCLADFDLLREFWDLNIGIFLFYYNFDLVLRLTRIKLQPEETILYNTSPSSD